MNRLLKYFLLLVVASVPLGSYAGKTVKIKLTGTAYENIRMKVGSSRTEIISEFPYEFEVPKQEMPVRLTFESENYLYYTIDVPRKPYDTTGHVYLVKINETAMQMGAARMQSAQNSGQFMGATVASEPVTGIDVTKGVNAAPVTGAVNDKTFAVIITNEDYEMATKVDNAVNDGLAFKEYCTKTLGIPGENVKYGVNLSYGKMRKVFRDISDLSNLYDGKMNLLVFYAGHGIPDNETKDAFLMPVDADGTDTSICFSLNDLYDNLNSMPLNRCVVFLDACFSGACRDGSMVVAARGVKIKPKATRPMGKTIVFTATSGDEAAYSYKEEQHGLFTFYLLKKLQESKGKVNLGELSDYLSENVGKQSRMVNGCPQTPTVAVPSEMNDNWRSIKLR